MLGNIRGKWSTGSVPRASVSVPPLGIPLSFVIGSSLGTGSHVFQTGLKQCAAEDDPLASHWEDRHVSSCPEYLLLRLELLASETTEPQLWPEFTLSTRPGQRASFQILVFLQLRVSFIGHFPQSSWNIPTRLLGHLTLAHTQGLL